MPVLLNFLTFIFLFCSYQNLSSIQNTLLMNAFWPHFHFHFGMRLNLLFDIWSKPFFGQFATLASAGTLSFFSILQRGLCLYYLVIILFFNFVVNILSYASFNHGTIAYNSDLKKDITFSSSFIGLIPHVISIILFYFYKSSQLILAIYQCIHNAFNALSTWFSSNLTYLCFHILSLL